MRVLFRLCTTHLPHKYQICSEKGSFTEGVWEVCRTSVVYDTIEVRTNFIARITDIVI